MEMQSTKDKNMHIIAKQSLQRKHKNPFTLMIPSENVKGQNQKLSLEIQSNIKENTQKVDPIPQGQKDISPQSFFNKYIEILKNKILKRKVILFSLNITLKLIAITFFVFYIIKETSTSTQNQSQIDQIFNSQTSILILLCIFIVAILSFIFSIVIYKGKVIMLHCYWITCLAFLIIFSIVAVSAFSILNMNCQQPSNFILQRVRLTNLSGLNLFCSDTCPCNNPNNLIQNINIFGKVQDCPGWYEQVYSKFFSSIQQEFQCSGWCTINSKSYFTFYDSQSSPPQENKINCFSSIQQKIQQDTQYLRVFSIIICVFLIVIIFYSNYYIFMEKEDEQRQIKKLKAKIQKANKKMEDQLKTSKRMLQ